ncbi:MAG: sulfatase, partial [Planctomycetes bacterium]|nr:sulfatase [Planctomycetota bacterium]
MPSAATPARILGFALRLVTGALLSACGDGGPPDGPRGVLLITCDTLRADRLGLYGHSLGTSPNLDALAREALVFDNAWSTVPITGPALSALLTGRMPEELGLDSNRTLLAGAAATLAESLAGAGVETAAIVSNWVLRRRSELPDAGVQQGFAHFDDRMEVAEKSRPNLRERLAPDTTDAALAWLDGRTDERPLFLWVHYQDPHGPYTAPADCLVEPEPGVPAEPELALGTDQVGHGTLPAYQVTDGERRPAVYRARYEAEIRFFDRELGRLIDGLRARGWLERVLLVFTADHGESLGEHGYYFSHGQNLHRELLRVPLFLRPPGGAEVTRRSNAPASHLDLYPTVLNAFGLAPGPTRGIDLLAGEPPAERVLPQYLRGAWGATGARYRLIAEKGRRQVFDLAADSGELNDLAPSRPELVRALAEGHQAFVRRLAPATLRA